MTFEFRRPLGLVLAGGGAHGAWQAEFVRTLWKRCGLRFDHVLGFSAGALTGAACFVDRLDELHKRWHHIAKARLTRVRPGFFPPHLYWGRGIERSVEYLRDESVAVSRACCRFTIVTTLEENGRRRRVHHHFSPRAEHGWDGPIFPKLVASCSIPKLFPPVLIETAEGPQVHVDGGARFAGPLDLSEMAHCADVIALQMVRPDEFSTPRGWHPYDMLDHRGRVGLNALMIDALRALTRGKKAPRVFHAYPGEALPYRMLGFSNKSCRRALAQGAVDAAAFMSDPEARLF